MYKPVLAVTTALLLVAVAGCSSTPTDNGSTGHDNGSDTLSLIQAAGEVSLGLPHQPPYAGVDRDGAPLGVGTALTVAIFEALGVSKFTYNEVPYSELVPGLQGGRWDQVHLLQVTTERCEAVDFSDPIETEAFVFAVPASDPAFAEQVMSDFVDDSGIRLGVLAGSALVKELTTLGVPSERLIEFPDLRSILDGMRAGRVEATVAAASSLRLFSKDDDSFIITDTVPGTEPHTSAAAFRKGDTEIIEAFNEQLKEMQASGEFDRILKDYGFDPALPKAVTTEELCAS